MEEKIRGKACGERINRMLLSIIIPVYNGEKYLGKCLESIFCQTKKLEFEVIIVNDASKDKTVWIMAEYERKYPDKIRAFHHTDNLGVSAARNSGLRIARGIWVAFVDADDLLKENFFECINEKMDCDLILFDMCRFKEEKEIAMKISDFHSLNRRKVRRTAGHERRECVSKRKKELVFHYGVQDRDMLIKKLLTGVGLLDGHSINLASPWAKIYRREFIEHYGFYFLEEVKIGEDMLFNLQAFAYQEKIQYNPRIVYYYRQHSESVMCGYYENFIEEDKKFSKNLLEILERLNVPENIRNLYYSSALEGVILCLRRQIFLKESKLSQEEKYALLDSILIQEPYKTAVNKVRGGGMELSWKRRIVAWLLRKRRYGPIALWFYIHG